MKSDGTAMGGGGVFCPTGIMLGYGIMITDSSDGDATAGMH